MGQVYFLCMSKMKMVPFAEVVRRKASMRLYMDMAGQLAERLATKREVEVRRREQFLKAQSAFLPRDVFEG
uniref:Uncharacterized protein n=1 Tax=Nelumbo nucifera TaxID=4432 RepID=A0A822YBV4_NELNU|nr:TPA_asm: hypothetical protein HUJ06_030459 [Nelumbo nucifera]